MTPTGGVLCLGAPTRAHSPPMTVIDREDPDLVSVFDELPLWSSPFGLELLEIVRMRRGMRVLDVGCGAGFPALELAGRLGSTSRVVGIDPWRGALARAGAKASRHGLTNVNLVCGAAEALPFPDATFDAVVFEQRPEDDVWLTWDAPSPSATGCSSRAASSWPP